MTPVIELADAAHRDFYATMTTRSGGDVHADDEMLAWRGTVPSPIIVNGAVAKGSGPADPEDALQRASAFFAGHGHAWSLAVREHTDHALERAAAARGMTMVIELAVMVLEGDPRAVPKPDGVEISAVADAGAVSAYADVAAAAFGTEAAAAARSAFAVPAAILADDIEAVIAWSGDRPVAVALAHVGAFGTTIGWVGTREEARRRGLGAAVTAAALDRARAHGTGRPAVLQASPLGVSVYERLGFTEVTRYREYESA